MVICRYFQQGSCRYGAACRNEHVYGNQYTYRNANTNQNKPPVTPNQNDTAYWVHSINTDMFAAEQGKQWLLTSYGPFKGKANFPSFDDHSFEEVRWLMWEAQKNGDVNYALQIYTRLAQEAKQKFKSYQTPTRELLDIVKNVYLAADTSNPQTNVFGQNTAPIFNQPQVSSSFGGQFPQQQPSSNIFSNTTQVQNTYSSTSPPLATNQSIFGTKSSTTTSVFNQPNVFTTNQQSQQPFSSLGNVFSTQPNIFTSQTQPNANVFNAAGSSNTFSKSENRSIFNTQQPQYPGTNIFNQTPSQNVFTQSQNTVHTTNLHQPIGVTNTFNQPQTNVFGQSQITNSMETSSPNEFGRIQNTVPTTNIFNTPQTCAPNVFAQQNQNVFVQQQTNTAPIQSNTNIFGSASIQKPANETNKTNIFGAKDTTPSTSQINQNQNRIDDDVYSKMEDLMEEELNAFNADSFEFGHLPELPPPLSLC